MAETDPYLAEWDPRAYLEQYYSTPDLPEDSRALLSFLIEQLARRPGGFDRDVEVGCGPTVYAALAIAPHVRELSLADYLPANLREVRRWLDAEPDAHDWGVYLRAILEMEGVDSPTGDLMAGRAAAARRKVVAVGQVDLRRRYPFGSPRAFDLVASFFCAEAISTDPRDWESYLGKLAGLVIPGGMLVLAAMRRCRGYMVLGRTFPAVPVDEEDFHRALPDLGFPPAETLVRMVPIREWASEGFDSICLVAATKAG